MKALNFPNDIQSLGKNKHEMMKFMKSGEFRVLMKTRIHIHFNKMMVNQFNFENDKKEYKPPELLKNFFTKSDHADKAPMEGTLNERFYYHTDSTGNNHPVVRLILKRRPWLQRIDKIGKFTHIHFFWTQWQKPQISDRLKAG